MNVKLRHFREIAINSLLTKQEGRCFVCGKDFTEKKRIAVQSNARPEGEITELDLQLVHIHCLSGREKHRRQIRARDLRSQNFSAKEIAAMMNVSITSVYNYLRGNDGENQNNP